MIVLRKERIWVFNLEGRNVYGQLGLQSISKSSPAGISESLTIHSSRMDKLRIVNICRCGILWILPNLYFNISNIHYIDYCEICGIFYIGVYLAKLGL